MLIRIQIEKEDIIADFIFFAISFLVTLLALYLFDIHQNFYSGETLFPPQKHVFASKRMYLFGGLAGSILGFFVIKLFLLGLKNKEDAWKNKSSRLGK